MEKYLAIYMTGYAYVLFCWRCLKSRAFGDLGSWLAKMNFGGN